MLRALGRLLSSCLMVPRISARQICVVNLSVKTVKACSLIIHCPRVFTTTIPVYNAIGPDQLSITGSIGFHVFRKSTSSMIPIGNSHRTCGTLGTTNTSIRCVRFPNYGRKD